jgi:hypothetical protein
MRTKWKILIAVVLVAVALLVADDVVRCHGKPLTRDEAFERASSRIQRFSQKFDVGNTPLQLLEESFDADQNTWTFKFRNSTCEAFVVADRCYGTDMGGTTCNPR